MYFGWCLRGLVCNSQPAWRTRSGFQSLHPIFFSLWQRQRDSMVNIGKFRARRCLEWGTEKKFQGVSLNIDGAIQIHPHLFTFT